MGFRVVGVRFGVQCLRWRDREAPVKVQLSPVGDGGHLQQRQRHAPQNFGLEEVGQVRDAALRPQPHHGALERAGLQPS